MSLAEVCTPVSGFRSTIPTFSCQRNARLRPRPSRLVPTTWPSGFTAFAWLTAPPSVPRSWIDTSTTGGAGTRGMRSDRRPATELRASPQPSLHGGFGRRSIESLYQDRSEEHTSELQSHSDLVCRLLLEKKKKKHQ